MGTTSYFDSPGKESYKIGNWQPGEEEYKEGEMHMYATALEGMGIDEVDENDDEDAGMREFKKLQDKQKNDLKGKFT